MLTLVDVGVLRPGANELQEGFQNGACQHQRPHGRKSSPNDYRRHLCP